MKCKDCTACIKGYFKDLPNGYVCTGVPDPFVIVNVDGECTQYNNLKTGYLTEKNDPFGANGVTNVIKEISEDYKSLEDEWKYVITVDDLSVIIKYLERKEGEWDVEETISIPLSLAERILTEALNSTKSEI